MSTTSAPISESQYSGSGARTSSRVNSWLALAPYACGTLVAVALLILVPLRVHDGLYLNHVSGAWATLADDLTHGVLYRPIVSEIGYGGTRYLPLHFLLHGALSALGMPLLMSGHLVSIGSALLLFSAAFIVLRRTGAPRWLALSLAVLPLASRTAFMAAAGVRGDLIALALGVMGLALAPRRAGDAAWPSVLLLGLAVLAKPTLIWAPAGLAVSLFVSGLPVRAVAVPALVGVLVAAGVAATQIVSGGALLEALKACSSGGEVSFKQFVGGLGYVRPGDLAWIVGGLALTFLRGRAALANPICAAAPFCVAVTLVLYTSKGIHVNHLVDATAMGALCTAIAFVSDAARPRLVRWTLVIGTLLGTIEAVALDAKLQTKAELEQAARALPAGDAPVLSEHPWVPLLAGERPVLLDAFSLALTRNISPEVDADLARRLETCSFRAVVLLGRPEATPWWYDNVHFGTGFRERLLQHYEFDRVVGALALYKPSCGRARTTTAHSEPGDTVLMRGQQPSRVRRLLAELRSPAPPR